MRRREEEEEERVSGVTTLIPSRLPFIWTSHSILSTGSVPARYLMSVGETAQMRPLQLTATERAGVGARPARRSAD